MKPLFSLFIPGLVQPKQSVRVTSKPYPHGYQPTKVKNYEAYVRGLAVEEWMDTDLSPQHDIGTRALLGALDMPLELIATIYLPRPKSRKNRERYPFPDRKPDIGNCMKPVEDAIEAAGVFVNDSRIVHSNVWKKYADDHAAGVVVELFSIEPSAAPGEVG